MATTSENQSSNGTTAGSSASSTFSVGASLRSARERMGKSGLEVASQLRIRLPYLLALEEGRFKDLPGGTYATGFLRSYAEFLNLDGDEMVRRFKDESAGALTTRSELVFPSPVSEGRVPRGGVLFLGLVLAVAAYGAWYWVSGRETSVATMIPELPKKFASMLDRSQLLQPKQTQPAPEQNVAATEPEPTPASEAASPAPEPPPAPVANAPEEAKPESAKVPDPPKPVEPLKPTETAKPGQTKGQAKTPEAPPAPSPQVQSAQAPQAPTPAPAPSPQSAPAKAEPIPAVAPSQPVVAATPAVETSSEQPADPAVMGDADHRVVLKAVGDDCWMEVREMDGRLLISRLLRKGETYAVPSRPGLSLKAGNAGALDIYVDGKKINSLGRIGQVRSDLSLDPNKLAPAPAAAPAATLPTTEPAAAPATPAAATPASKPVLKPATKRASKPSGQPASQPAAQPAVKPAPAAEPLTQEPAGQ